ncbi:squalene synthase HpnC [uncultured Jatrophihabitans sp.]|uniref:squalene synthase HpnC n=1 Tax=uncultured Jatrophihabitans sp. TaxID=1610747 RepID=UPI0035CC4B83
MTAAGEVDGTADPALLRTLARRSAGQMSAENFPVALRVLPAEIRADLAAVYRFARFVDDVGDEAPTDTDGRLHLLDLLEQDVLLLGAGTPTLPPVVDLAAVTTRRAVPLTTYLDLVEANRVDQRRTSYETFDDLLGYCRLSAAPVGRIVLHVAGAANRENIADSDAVCAALQVLEHCQDVGEDARRGRVYLPAAELRSHGVADTALRAAGTSPALRAVLAEQVTRARGLLEQGRPLVSRLSGWARLAVTGYVAGGLATADALERADHEVLARPVTPSKARTARAAAWLWVRR